MKNVRRRWNGNQLEVLLPLWLFTLLTSFVLEFAGLELAAFVLLEALAVTLGIAAMVIVVEHFRNRLGNQLQFDLLYPVVLLFLAVWTLRLDVEIHTEIFIAEASLEGVEVIVPLNFVEHLFNSIIHALQSFSMDESYTDFILTGKAYILQNASNPSIGYWHAAFYGFYCAALNVLVAVAGGAVLLDILANIFPEIQLRLQFLRAKNTRSYVFSELNERSIVLAESIRERSNRSDWKEHAFIVFTDTYNDRDEESKSELMIRARRINAVCLKDDVSLLRRLSWGPISYFLMDDEEQGNVEALAALSDVSSTLTETNQNVENFIDGWKAMNSDVRIYVFSHQALIMRMIEHFNKLCMDNELEYVMAKPIDISENLSLELMTEHPIFRAVEQDEHPEKRTEVHLALVGDSQNLYQLMRTGYWCGQMLNPYSTELKRIIPHYHILCTDEDAYHRYMDSEMPSVVEELETENHGFPYARYSFTCVETITRATIQRFVEGLDNLDYGMIDTEDDLSNIEICEWMKQAMARKILRGNKNIELWCVVHNQDLNTIENSLQENSPILYVGNLREQYQIDAVESGNQDKAAIQVDDSYKSSRAYEIFSNLYNYRASKALALYYPYHMFSMGARKKSDGSIETDPATITRRGLALLLNAGVDTDNMEDSMEGMRERIDRTIWLEKIRWNSFVKCEGYVEPSIRDVMENYHRLSQNPKTAGQALVLHKFPIFDDCKLKLHGCLMDLRNPRGIVLMNMDDEIYNSLQPKLQNVFKEELLAYEEGNPARRKKMEEVSWGEYMTNLLKMSEDEWGFHLKYPLDELDIYSLLAKTGKGDYKDYDARLLISLMVRNRMRLASEEEQEAIYEELHQSLERNRSHGGYLSEMYDDWLKAARTIR